MTPEGFRGAAFLQAPDSTNDHDLGLFEIGAAAGPRGAGRATVGLYHLAWEVDTLDELEAAPAARRAGALVGTLRPRHDQEPLRQDPDGLEFEVVWLIPGELLDDAALRGPQEHRTAGPGQGEGPLRRPDPGRGRHLRIGVAVGLPLAAASR